MHECGAPNVLEVWRESNTVQVRAAAESILANFSNTAWKDNTRDTFHAIKRTFRDNATELR